MAARKTFPPLAPAVDRFDQCFEVDAVTGCWNWTRGKSSSGYGRFYVNRDRRQVDAHRYSLEQKLGRSVAGGLEALHSCDNKQCVNPAHLSEGTHAENMSQASERQRSFRPSQLITGCKNGHPFDTENTILARRTSAGRTYTVRKCRACNRQQCREYKLRKKAA